MGLPRLNEGSYAHFVTTKTYSDRRIFGDAKRADIVVSALHFYAARYRCDLLAYCVMPDYVHFIVQWDSGAQPALTISKIAQSIKSHSAKEIIQYLTQGRRKPSLSPYTTASERSRLLENYHWVDRGNVHTPPRHRIWQPSFYDFNIYSERMLEQKVAYIHWNPVRAGLRKSPEDWPWSSVTNYHLQ